MSDNLNQPGQTNSNPGQTPPTTPPDPNADPVRQFKQSELDHLFAERARQAQGKALGDLLKDLGVEKADDLKAIIARAREHENANKTALEKAQADSADWQKKFAAIQAERDQAIAQFKESTRRSAVLAEATKQNFRDDALDDVWRVLDPSKLSEKDGALAGVEDAVKAIAKAKPHWLKAKSGAGGTPRPSGTASQRSSDGTEKTTLGLRL